MEVLPVFNVDTNFTNLYIKSLRLVPEVLEGTDNKVASFPVVSRASTTARE